MKKILCAILTVAMTVCFAPKAMAEGFDKGYTLLTSNNPDCYSLFTIDGFDLMVQGKNALDTITEINFVYSPTPESSLRSGSDGLYSAKLTAPSRFEGRLDILLQFEKDIQKFTLFCDKNGLYFPINSLKSKNAAVLSRIIDSPPEASVAYLTCSDDIDDIKTTQAQIRALAQGITDNAQTSYEKAWEIYDWLCRQIYYDHDASHTDVSQETVAIANTLATQKTVCSGYANLYCALLEAAGIDAVTIKGSVTAGGVTFETLETGRQNHEWSAFFCEEQDRWIFVDTCWGSENNYRDGAFLTGGYVDTRYFDPTDEAFALTHRCDKAERRNYLADFSGLTKTDETIAHTTANEAEASADTQTTAETNRKPPETTAQTTVQQNVEQESLSEPLVRVAIIMSIGVIVFSVALIIIKRNGKKK